MGRANLSAGSHNFVCTELQHAAAATTAMGRANGKVNEPKGTNAQGIRHRHMTSPPPQHGIARPNTYHADEGGVGTHRLAHEGQAMLRGNESQASVVSCSVFPAPTKRIRRVYLTSHRGDSGEMLTNRTTWPLSNSALCILFWLYVSLPFTFTYLYQDLFFEKN